MIRLRAQTTLLFVKGLIDSLRFVIILEKCLDMIAVTVRFVPRCHVKSERSIIIS